MASWPLTQRAFVDCKHLSIAKHSRGHSYTKTVAAPPQWMQIGPFGALGDDQADWLNQQPYDYTVQYHEINGKFGEYEFHRIPHSSLISQTPVIFTITMKPYSCKSVEKNIKRRKIQFDIVHTDSRLHTCGYRFIRQYRSFSVTDLVSSYLKCKNITLYNVATPIPDFQRNT